MARNRRIVFDRDGEGAAEVVAAVGLIANSISFDKWSPLIPLGMRDVKAIVGPEAVDALTQYYHGEYVEDHDLSEPLFYLQQAVAFFTWLKIIPTLDAQHDEAGRGKRLGENEHGMTALEQFKDEENIRRLAYEATDMLIESLDSGEYDFWIDSPKCRIRERLLIRCKEEFDEFYHIGSHRLFVTLTPIIREIQGQRILPVMGNDLLEEVLSGEMEEKQRNSLYEPAARALALLTMKKAVERLPVEVLPEGVVQVQQSQPVRQRMKAEKEARNAVAASLGEDARQYLEQLQAAVDAINGTGKESETGIVGPLVHKTGFSF